MHLLRNFAIGIVFFHTVSLGYTHAEEDAAPLATFVFRGNYTDAIERPTLDHEYTLLEPSPLDDRYFPDVSPKFDPLTIHAAFNVKPIDGFIDFVGNLFSDRKRINRAYELEQNGALEQAFDDYAELANGEGTYRHEAMLRQIVIDLRRNNSLDAMDRATILAKLSDPHYSAEGYYFKMLVNAKNSNFNSVINDARIQAKSKSLYPSAKIEFLKLYALFRVGHFKEFNKTFTVFSIRYPRSQHIGKAYYYRAMSDCGQELYVSCAAYFLGAASKFADLSSAYASTYYAAWAFYRGGRMEKAKLTLAGLRPNIVTGYKDGRYLQFLIALKKGDAEQTYAHFSKLGTDSDLQQRAVLNLLKEKRVLDKHSRLKESVKNVRVELPYVNLYKAFRLGNEHFKAGDYQKTEVIFLNALGLNTDAKSTDRIRFNLAQTYLKLSKNVAAAEIFADLTNQTFRTNQSKYHHMLALYRLNQWDKFDDIPSPSDLFDSQSKQSAMESDVFRAAIGVSRKKFSAAVSLLVESYKTHKDSLLLDYAADIAHHSENFDAVERIYALADAKTEKLALFSAASLLAKNKPVEALKRITPFQTSQLFAMRRILLEAWTKNDKNRDIVAHSESWLENETNPEFRYAYLFYGASAKFNMGDYYGAKQNYHDMLPMAKDEAGKSQLYYNIVDTSLKTGDRKIFYKEAHEILKKSMEPEIRFQLVQIIAGTYIEDGREPDAENLYAEYEKIYDYRIPEIRERRILLHHNRKNWEKCTAVAYAPVKGETIKNKINRITVGSKCAIKNNAPQIVIKEIQPTLTVDADYRVNERTLLLAHAHQLLGDHDKTLRLLEKPLPKSSDAGFNLNLRIVKAESYAKTGDMGKAAEQLGNVGDFRNTDMYSRAIHVSADILIAGENYKDAAQLLLRGIVLPSVAEREKNSLKLKLAEVYLMEDDREGGKKSLKLIDPSTLGDDEKKTYLRLKEKIQP